MIYSIVKGRFYIFFVLSFVFLTNNSFACVFCINHTLDRNMGSVWYEPERVRSGIGVSQKPSPEYETERRESISFFDQTNPIKMIFVGLIGAYRFFLSSLDGSNCQFRPSCSHFAVEAIRKNLVTGVLLTGDRLIRCNPFTPGKYDLTEDETHHYDPVENYELGLEDIF